MDPCDLTELIRIEMYVSMDDELLKGEERRVHEDGDNAARTQEVERPAQNATRAHRRYPASARILSHSSGNSMPSARAASGTSEVSVMPGTAFSSMT